MFVPSLSWHNDHYVVYLFQALSAETTLVHNVMYNMP
eukprot:COSAG06_NODE_11396_length_1516_cov_1.327452_1_plen_36_part_10